MNRLSYSGFLHRQITWLGFWAVLLRVTDGPSAHEDPGVRLGGVERTESAPTETPRAPQLLAEVLARLPHEPLRVAGSITVRRRHGIPESHLRFEMELRWGDRVPSARYRIMDALGADLEDLIVTQGAGGVPRCQYVSIQRASTDFPGMAELIQNTDLTWADLTLAFLWWEGGAVVGKGTALGRDCWVVEVPVPEAARQLGGDGAYTGLRLWIDQAYRFVLQVEGIDRSGRAVRRLWVRSLKKIDDRWLIKDIEVETVGRARRTKLSVEQVEPLS